MFCIETTLHDPAVIQHPHRGRVDAAHDLGREA
jgi:hypothetical protein